MKKILTSTAVSRSVDLLHNGFTAWVILALSLAFTVAAYFVATKIVREREADRLAFRAEEVVMAISARMQVYQSVLNGAAGLFLASDNVTRSEWKSYVDSLHIYENWPGIQGMGYAVPLDPTELQGFVESVRSDGFPDFTVQPAGVREQYSSIIYLEPFDWRNRRAFGYDMWSNEIRRLAMNRARESGQDSMSGIITLVQETEDDVQKGFLTYVPVYRKGADIDTVEKRRAALQGWVYAAFRANDLMHGILGSEDSILSFEILDASDAGESTLLFASKPNLRDPEEAYGFEKAFNLEMHGRTWKINFFASDRAMSGLISTGPTYIAVAAGVVDLLLFYVILSISFLRRKAQSIANRMTRELSAKTEALKQTKIELQRRLDELEEAHTQVVQSANLANLGEMAGGIAHEINNPLTIIVGYMDKLHIQCQTKDYPATEIQKSIEATKKTVGRIKGIVTGLRNFSRDTHNEEFAECRAEELIEESLDLCREKFRHRGVAIEVSGDVNAWVTCRRLQVSQVLINLLSNALHAVQQSPEKRVAIDCRAVGSLVRFSITDSGSGVPEEIAHRIFHPFFTTKKVGQGTGLGLSISKGMIESQNGTLRLDRTVEFTRFIIELPRTVPRVQAA